MIWRYTYEYINYRQLRLPCGLAVAIISVATYAGISAVGTPDLVTCEHCKLKDAFVVKRIGARNGGTGYERRKREKRSGEKERKKGSREYPH